MCRIDLKWHTERLTRITDMIGRWLIKAKDKIELATCKLDRHKFIVVREPTPTTYKYEHAFFFNNAWLRYCQYCKRLERFTYHCLGLNPPEYIVDDNKEIDYSNLVGHLVQDSYNLEV